MSTEVADLATAKNARSDARFNYLGADANISLASMEGIYEPIVEKFRYFEADTEPSVSLTSMEGILEPVVKKAEPKAVSHEWKIVLPGFAAAASVAGVAFLIHAIPDNPLSTVIIAIILGVLVRNLLPVPVSVQPGCKKIVKKMIPVAIVFTGAKLDLATIAQIGVHAIVIIIISIAVAVGVSYYVGRWLGLCRRTAMLIGAGTGICGNSAIIAVAPLVDAEDDDLALSLGTVNLLGLVSMLACSWIGGWLNMSDASFGIWAGTSIHAVPQVVAAGQSYSEAALTIATLTKLTRVTFLAPLVFLLAISYAKHHKAAAGDRVVIHYARFVPWFVWGFVLLALLNTLSLIPTLNFQPAKFLGVQSISTYPLPNVLAFVAKIILVLAMAAIGLELNIRHLASVGARAIITGLIASVALGAASLLMVSTLI